MFFKFRIKKFEVKKFKKMKISRFDLSRTEIYFQSKFTLLTCSRPKKINEIIIDNFF